LALLSCFACSNAETDIGNKRGYKISVPGSFPQLLPEHDKFLHLQNFTKCDIAVTKQSEDDKEAVSQLVFGNLYPLPAPAGQDISHFFNGESLEDVDIVLYLSGTKHHYVQTEDVLICVSNLKTALQRQICGSCVLAPCRDRCRCPPPWARASSSSRTTTLPTT
jgi:Cu2+-containing amine oxidase